MYLAPALVAGALASRASAFLLPLEVTKAAARPAFEVKPPPSVVMVGGSVDLDCHDCPFVDPENPSVVQVGVESKIQLEFTIDSEDRLNINDFPVYPHESDASNSSPVFVTTRQIRAEDGQESDPVQLDFALEALEPIRSIHSPDATLQPLRFTVLGLQGRPVKVDTIVVDLLQTPDQAVIARFSQIPFELTPGAKTCDTSSQWSLCRVRAIVTARLQSIMAAARARAHGAHGWIKNGKGCHGRKFGGMGRHHGHHRHGHHMGGWSRHHRFHRFGHILHQTIRFFVIPALLGIIGGLMASAVGMLVGQMISYLWIRFHRRGQRGNASARTVEVAIEEEEKGALMTEDIPPPPKYQDLEACAEEVEEVTDEKH
ncbi:uncharacterized protein PV06_01657 [Exophiala oligosperma]|uniref:DUF7728 domain-containing protein n=1 Tax=Exophiala oligosperma TaxID=215243 RepID=A0A0D2DSH3_9EURO|nr:uncharacterized protein PV06_01657 [Exophiala oligosperma]KIW45958.1 hypothetical protein PV06_01657 [Exophiala oligosperma]